jgi:hypothetical protein
VDALCDTEQLFLTVLEPLFSQHAAWAGAFRDSVGACVRACLADLDRRLGPDTQLDTHSEKTLVAEMVALDGELTRLRRVVERAVEFTNLAAGVRRDLAAGRGLCAAAPAFGEEPVLKTVLDRGKRDVEAVAR